MVYERFKRKIDALSLTVEQQEQIVPLIERSSKLLMDLKSQVDETAHGILLEWEDAVQYCLQPLRKRLRVHCAIFHGWNMSLSSTSLSSKSTICNTEVHPDRRPMAYRKQSSQEGAPLRLKMPNYCV